MLRLKTWFWALGLFATQTFILCVLWNLFEPRLEYIRLLEAFLPAFKWLTFGRLVLGMVESFLYGAYIAVGFVTIHNYLYLKNRDSEPAERREEQKASSGKAA